MPPRRASARIGGLPLGLVNLHPQNLNGFLRDQLGRFTGGGYQRALAEAHNEMVTKLQAIAREEFDRAQKKVGRPQNRGTFRLAISKPGNSRITASGFSFGLPEHYDRTMRFYWRFIEEGGLNPLLKAGPVAGVFWNPGVAGPDRASFRTHGRFAWRSVDGDDRMRLIHPYFEGYHFHDATRDRFLASDIPERTYAAVWARHGFIGPVPTRF